MAKNPKANTEAAPPAAVPPVGQAANGSAAPAPEPPARTTAAVRRSVKPADDNSEQEALDGLLRMADVLAGVEGFDEPERTEPKAKAAATPVPPDADDDDTDAATEAAEGDEIEATDEDGPIIPEDDEEQDEDAAADGAEDKERSGLTPEQIVRKLDTKLFKKRQQVRDLTAQLEAKTATEKALAEKLAKVEALPQGALELGPFSGVESDEDIARIDAELQARIDWCEDHEDGFEGQDKDGNPISYTKQEIRQWRRNATNARLLADKARATLKLTRESEATARKRYPFVFDPSKPLYQRVLDAAAETPGINALPNKALVLGRLAMAKLIESGDYMLVRKGAKPAPATNGAKPKPKAPPAPPSTSRQGSPDGEGDLHRRIASGDKKALEEWAESLIPA